MLQGAKRVGEWSGSETSGVLARCWACDHQRIVWQWRLPPEAVQQTQPDVLCVQWCPHTAHALPLAPPLAIPLSPARLQAVIQSMKNMDRACMPSGVQHKLCKRCCRSWQPACKSWMRLHPRMSGLVAFDPPAAEIHVQLRDLYCQARQQTQRSTLDGQSAREAKQPG